MDINQYDNVTSVVERSLIRLPYFPYFAPTDLHLVRLKQNIFTEETFVDVEAAENALREYFNARLAELYFRWDLQYLT